MNTPEIIISAITASATIIALFLSIISIRQSNKQSLFERRLSAFLKVEWMYYLIEPNNSLAKSVLEDMKKGPFLAPEYLYYQMTNSNYLEEIQPVINYSLDSEWQRKYLIKIEDMRSLSEEIRLIFPQSVCQDLSEFVYYYSEMLVALYKYKVCIDSINESCKKIMREFPNDDQLENKQRKIVEKYVEGTFELGQKLLWTLDKTKSKIRL